MVFSPPLELKFSVGSTTDRYLVLDELFSLSKRLPNKSRRRGLGKYASRLALQKSVASRSSALRQGKFAEARTRIGAQVFPATKAAEMKALSAAVSVNSSQKMKMSRDAKHDITKLLKLLRKVPANDPDVAKR